jgi:hypothetical protein
LSTRTIYQGPASVLFHGEEQQPSTSIPVDVSVWQHDPEMGRLGSWGADFTAELDLAGPLHQWALANPERILLLGDGRHGLVLLDDCVVSESGVSGALAGQGQPPAL